MQFRWIISAGHGSAVAVFIYHLVIPSDPPSKDCTVQTEHADILPSTFPLSRAFKLSFQVPNLPGAFCHCCNPKNQHMRQRKEEARAEQTMTEDDSDTGRCPQHSPLAHLPSRDAKADVFHCCDAFVREVVDLGEVLELHHIEVSFARLHPAPLCLDIPILHGHGWQKGGFAMDSVKQEPGGQQRGNCPPATATSWDRSLGASLWHPRAYTRCSDVHFPFSPGICSTQCSLPACVVPPFFSKCSGLEQVLPRGHAPNAGDRNVLTPLCVHPGQRRWGEPNRGGCQWSYCSHQQLSIHPPNPKPRAAVPASTDYQETL